MPSPRIAALLALAMLVTGIALGAAAGPNAPQTLASSAAPVIAVVSPALAPAAATTPPTPPSVTATTDTPAPDTTATTPASTTPAATTTPATTTTPSATTPTTPSTTTARPAGLPPVKHVWVIMLADLGYADTWTNKTDSPYLAGVLRPQGTLLQNYFGVAHGTLPNGIALLSGQGPNPDTQAGCPTPTDVTPGTIATSGNPLAQAAGTGCLYPAIVPSLPDQLTGAGLTWKAYMADVVPGAVASGPTCPAPRTTRDPFVYFHAIADDAVCGTNVVGLDQISADLATSDRTPAFSYIAPATGDLNTVETYVHGVVDQITASAAYKKDGLLIITADQAPPDGPHANSFGCICTPHPWPATTNAGSAAAPGPGGGQVGALLLSQYVKAGAAVVQNYDHVSLLRSIEDLFALDHLGAAGDHAHRAFGPKVYAGYTPPAT